MLGLIIAARHGQGDDSLDLLVYRQALSRQLVTGNTGMLSFGRRLSTRDCCDSDVHLPTPEEINVTLRQEAFVKSLDADGSSVSHSADGAYEAVPHRARSGNERDVVPFG